MAAKNYVFFIKNRENGLNEVVPNETPLNASI